MSEETIERLLRETDVSKILNVSLPKVRSFRRNGDGPDFLRIGKSVRYRPEDVRSFIESAVYSPSRGASGTPSKRDPISLSEIFSKEN